MVAGIRLTPKKIAQLAYVGSKNKRCVYWDEDLPGFGVRVYPSGARRFVVSYRWNKKKLTKVLGSTETATLGKVRREARKYLDAQQDIRKRLVLQTVQLHEERMRRRTNNLIEKQNEVERLDKVRATLVGMSLWPSQTF